jgi:hypothetical protein
MKRTLIAVALLASACSGNPTAPTPAPVPVQAALAPASAPETPPPAVEPPPAPTTPVPTPVVALPAPSRELYDGYTANGHWYGQARVPERFTLEVTADALVVGGTLFPLLLKVDGSYTAGTYPAETFTASRGSSGAWGWTYTGSAGMASGSLEARK